MKFERRDYQDRIITQCTELYTRSGTDENGEEIQPIRSILVESPTGSGKTYIGMQVADEMHEITQDLMVVWVAMGKELINQAGREHEKFNCKHDLRTLYMFDKNRRAMLQAEIESRNCTVLMVVDECQHDAATTMTDVYQAIKPDMTLGLSATPYRVDKANLCFEKQIRDAGIHRLQRDGYLSKFDLHVIEEWTPQHVVDIYLEDPQKWGKSVFYWLNTDLATECNTLLARAGIRTSQIVGGTDYSQQILDFRNGDLDVLVNCCVLTEGFDCPELKTAWVRDSSKGPTIQMAGRAFRIHESAPRKNIVQSKNTKYSIVKTTTPEEQYVLKEGQWLSVKPNEKTNMIVAAALRRTIENYQPLPDFMLKKSKKGRRRGVDVDQD